MHESTNFRTALRRRIPAGLGLAALVTAACGGDADPIGTSGTMTTEDASAAGSTSTGATTTGLSEATSTTSNPEPTVDASTSTTTVGPADTDSTTGETSEPLPAEPCDGEAIALTDIPTIFAYQQSMVPPNPDTTGGMSSSSGGVDVDPDTVYVTLSNWPQVCADPEALLPCGFNAWEVTIAIPPEFQSPGIYNLLGQEVRGFTTEGTSIDAGDCRVDGGFDATFEIFSVDDKTVEGRLCHVDSFFSVLMPSLEGSFSAPRCQ